MFYFVPESDLRAHILEILKDGEKSISRVTRELKQKGHDYHRLMVTGYLKALADLGVIREKAIPPSKVYTIPPQRSANIYELIGEHVRARNLGYKKESYLCTQVLEALFLRPVFQSELNMCGYDEPAGVKKVSGEERSEARALAVNAGLRIGPRENAYQTRRSPPDDVTEIIVDVVLTISGTRQLRKGTKQTTLDL